MKPSTLVLCTEWSTAFRESSGTFGPCLLRGRRSCPGKTFPTFFPFMTWLRIMVRVLGSQTLSPTQLIKDSYPIEEGVLAITIQTGLRRTMSSYLDLVTVLSPRHSSARPSNRMLFRTCRGEVKHSGHTGFQARSRRAVQAAANTSSSATPPAVPHPTWTAWVPRSRQLGPCQMSDVHNIVYSNEFSRMISQLGRAVTFHPEYSTLNFVIGLMVALALQRGPRDFASMNIGRSSP